MKKHFGLSRYFVFSLAVMLCMPAHAMWRQTGQKMSVAVTQAITSAAHQARSAMRTTYAQATNQLKRTKRTLLARLEQPIIGRTARVYTTTCPTIKTTQITSKTSSFFFNYPICTATGVVAIVGTGVYATYTFNHTHDQNDSFTSWKNKLNDYLDALSVNKNVQSPTSKEDFIEAREAYLATMKKSFSQDSAWVEGTHNPSKDFLAGAFAPYVQKLIIKPGDSLSIIGDLHGDGVTLINTFEKLYRNNIINEQFKIKDGHVIIFLGDYTDRGPCGVEVLHRLFKLKAANPTKVFLLRGNHEDAYVNEYKPFFGSELNHKYAVRSHEDRQKFVYRIYDTLPVALYVGTGNGRYVLFCHGGLEVGFNPEPLLSASSGAIFMGIQKLHRAAVLARLRSTSSIDVDLSDKRIKDNADNIVPQRPRDLHFLWNDFNNSTKSTFNWYHEAGWDYGETLTKALLKRDNVDAVIRGHNHRLALKEGGFYSLYNGMVLTVTSFRHHKQSILCQDYSFLAINTGATINEWQVWHERDGVKKRVSFAGIVSTRPYKE